jgi:hypothetical protein
MIFFTTKRDHFGMRCQLQGLRCARRLFTSHGAGIVSHHMCLFSAESAAWGGLWVGGVVLLDQLGQSGDGLGDFIGDGRRGWQMGSGGVVAGLVSVPLGLDGRAVRGGVGGLALSSLGFEILLAGVLQGTLLLYGDTIAGFKAEMKRLHIKSWKLAIPTDNMLIVPVSSGSLKFQTRKVSGVMLSECMPFCAIVYC